MKVYIKCTKTYKKHYISVQVHFLCTRYNNRYYVSVHVHFLCTLYTNRHYVYVHVHFLCTPYTNRHYVSVHLRTLHLKTIKPSTDMQIILKTVLWSWGEVCTNVQKHSVYWCTVYTKSVHVQKHSVCWCTVYTKSVHVQKHSIDCCTVYTKSVHVQRYSVCYRFLYKPLVQNSITYTMKMYGWYRPSYVKDNVYISKHLCKSSWE